VWVKLLFEMERVKVCQKSCIWKEYRKLLFKRGADTIRVSEKALISDVWCYLKPQ
jgi:hypothetical protein